ncbi:MAG: cell envelope biogenesis protein OmpA, partial [Tannerellaceae bacterium]|nr:cell envelope biogenesis protein OmpA [Tannerellaceae bacterium]
GLSLILDPNRQGGNVSKLTAGGSQLINVFSKNFKLPQTMRVNAGLDFELAGVDWTAEAIYSKTLNDILYQNLAYEPDGTTLEQTYPYVAPDRRPLFERVTTGTDYALIYALSNTSQGYAYNLSLKGEKKFGFGLDLTASYTYTRSKSVNSGTSSVAQSNWAYNYTRGNPNDPELGFSAFHFPHRINAAAFYHASYARCWSTVAGLIYTGSSGAPYSIYYAGRDLNNDSANGNDLIFIPTDAQIDQTPFAATADYTEDAQKAAMKAWIARDPYLSKHRGEYFERYADNEKFEHHFDFHLAQKYSFNASGTVHSLELSLDILNIGNLFSREWGRYASAGGSATYYSPITYNGGGSFQFLHDANYNMRSYSDYYSRWRGQIGLKYTF